MVMGIARTWHKQLLKLGQRHRPCAGIRPCSQVTSKRALERDADEDRHICEQEALRRRCDAVFENARPGKPVRRDRLRQRHLAPGHPRIRMPTQKQHLEQEDRQAERILLLGSHDAAQRATLQLGRGVFGNADAAAMFVDLHAVGVDQGYSCIGSNQHAGMVDIADDDACVVNL